MDLQGSDKRYWFKNKKVGIGWVPVTWEGWAVTTLYIVGTLFWALTIFEKGEGPQEVKLFFIGLFVFTCLMITITVRFGEPLNWNFWNKNKK